MSGLSPGVLDRSGLPDFLLDDIDNGSNYFLENPDDNRALSDVPVYMREDDAVLVVDEQPNTSQPTRAREDGRLARGALGTGGGSRGPSPSENQEVIVLDSDDEDDVLIVGSAPPTQPAPARQRRRLDASSSRQGLVNPPGVLGQSIAVDTAVRPTISRRSNRGGGLFYTPSVRSGGRDRQMGFHSMQNYVRNTLMALRRNLLNEEIAPTPEPEEEPEPTTSRQTRGKGKGKGSKAPRPGKFVKDSRTEEQEVKEISNQCAVCLSPFTNITATRCGHVFCKSCIEGAIKAQKKCPTCRSSLRSMNDTVPLFL